VIAHGHIVHLPSTVAPYKVVVLEKGRRLERRRGLAATRSQGRCDLGDRELSREQTKTLLIALAVFPFSPDHVTGLRHFWCLDLFRSHRTRHASTSTMPTIEVLPNSTSISAPGWAYVPDNGYDPSKAPLQPSGSRKRNARIPGASGVESSARHNAAVQKRLTDLDKDNSKDVHIAVPSKQKEVGGRGVWENPI